MIIRGLCGGKGISAGFIVCLYIHCLCGSTYQHERVGIPLTGPTSPHLFVCHRPGPEIETSYIAVFFNVQLFDVGDH